MHAATQPRWDQAQADLQSSRVLLAAGQFYAASFFAQQCAEEALKALFIEQNARMPRRTHDLELLASQVGALAALQGELTVLVPVIDVARYPDDISGAPPVSVIAQVDAEKHFGAAERIFMWTDNQF